MIGFGIWLWFALYYGGERKWCKCAGCSVLALVCAASELYLLAPSVSQK